MPKKGNAQGRENLQRGRASGGNPRKGLDAIAANKEQEDRIRSSADVSPDDAVLEMFKEASVAAAKGLRKWNRSGGEPSRLMIEATKEARQLAVVAGDILRARGRATEIEAFFAEVADRIAQANLGESPVPIAAGG